MVLNGYCKIQSAATMEHKNIHVISKVSGAAPYKNKVKVGKSFEIDETRYSSINKLLKVLAYVNRFISHVNNKQEIDKKN